MNKPRAGLKVKRMTQNVRTVPLLVAFSLLASAATTAKADAGQTEPSCLYLHETRTDSKYAFTQASLIALSYARSAWKEAEAFEAERKAESNPQTLLIAMYRRHRRLNDQFLDLLRNLPDLSDQPTKRADTISTIEVERGKLWNDLIKATTLTLLGLVDQSKTSKDGTLQTLVITKAERKELLDRLLRAFPEVKAQAHKPGTSDVMFIASLYDQFLAGQYKSADE